MDKWCICPNCGGPAAEVGFLKGIDCPNPKCGHVTASQLVALARRRQRQAEEAKNS